MATKKGQAKQQKPRSSEYPRKALPDVLEFLQILGKLAGSGDAVSVAKAMEAVGAKIRTNNRFSGLVSSARQFGFIAVEGTVIALTDEGNAWLHGPKGGKDTVVRTAVGKPVFFSRLLRAYGGKGLPTDDDLAAYIYEGGREYGIIKTKTKAAAQVFRRSLEAAGMVSESGIVVQQVGGPAGASTQPRQDDAAQPATGTPETEAPPVSTEKTSVVTEPERPGQQSSTLQLGRGRTATLAVPGDLTASEAQRLKALIDLLVPEAPLGDG